MSGASLRAVRTAAAALLLTAAQAGAQPLPAGLQTLSVTHGGVAREVLVQVPAQAAPAAGHALVLALHGGGGHAAFMADDTRYGWKRTAASEGFVVAFPNGYSRWPGGRLATWNAGGCCGAARDRAVDDVGFLREVVATLRGRLPIDPARVFATGMSNGGMMALRLACDAADVFRAVASVAGTDATQACRPARPVALLQVHARDDTHVLYDGGAGPDAVHDRRQVMDFVSVPETVARWVERNRCTAAPVAEPPRPGVRCETHAGCAGDARVRLCTLDRGGHSWPGAERVRRGKAPASQDFDATAEIWAFFRAAGSR